MDKESRTHLKWSSFILDLRIPVITNTHHIIMNIIKKDAKTKSNRKKSSELDFSVAGAEGTNQSKKNYFDIRIHDMGN